MSNRIDEFDIKSIPEVQYLCVTPLNDTKQDFWLAYKNIIKLEPLKYSGANLSGEVYFDNMTVRNNAEVNNKFLMK